MKLKIEIENEKLILWGFAIFAIIVLSVSVFSVSGLFLKPAKMQEAPADSMKKISRMSLTAFDKDIAKEMMDKDGDGMCDICGMPVEMCISSGQIQCNMDSKSAIGILGSQHIHAKFSFYKNGELTDFTKLPGMASSFLHTDKELNKLHMHATGVPLLIFFKSVGFDLEAGKVSGNVNGNQIEKPLDYVFKDGDEIIINYSDVV